MIKLAPLFFLLSLFGCQQDEPSDSQSSLHYDFESDGILHIPVVIHVLYTQSEETNISLEKIQSQIEILNQDFGLLKPNNEQLPEEFSDLAVDMGIRFFLAEVDPNGDTTTGITRTFDQSFGMGKDAYKYTHLGGIDSWPVDRYLNIWVREELDQFGRVRLAGQAQFPGGNPETDGVMVSYKAFGTRKPVQIGLHLGKTTTHEVGHWLGLKHTDGPDCNYSDDVEDTPYAIGRAYLGNTNPQPPIVNCGTADMISNFMSTYPDKHLKMFTAGQREKVWSAFRSGGGRHQLYKNLSTGK